MRRTEGFLYVLLFRVTLGVACGLALNWAARLS